VIFGHWDVTTQAKARLTLWKLACFSIGIM